VRADGPERDDALRVRRHVPDELLQPGDLCGGEHRADQHRVLLPQRPGVEGGDLRRPGRVFRIGRGVLAGLCFRLV